MTWPLGKPSSRPRSRRLGLSSPMILVMVPLYRTSAGVPCGCGRREGPQAAAGARPHVPSGPAHGPGRPRRGAVPGATSGDPGVGVRLRSGVTSPTQRLCRRLPSDLCPVRLCLLEPQAARPQTSPRAQGSQRHPAQTSRPPNRMSLFSVCPPESPVNDTGPTVRAARDQARCPLPAPHCPGCGPGRLFPEPPQGARPPGAHPHPRTPWEGGTAALSPPRVLAGGPRLPGQPLGGSGFVLCWTPSAPGGRPGMSCCPRTAPTHRGRCHALSQRDRGVARCPAPPAPGTHVGDGAAVADGALGRHPCAGDALADAPARDRAQGCPCRQETRG